MLTKCSELEPGMSLLDTHYGVFDVEGDPRPLPIEEPHRLVSAISFHTRGGSDFIDLVVKAMNPKYRLRYSNKMLVVVEVGYKTAGKNKLVCAYSYDDSRFGLVEYEVDVP